MVSCQWPAGDNGQRTTDVHPSFFTSALTSITSKRSWPLVAFQRSPSSPRVNWATRQAQQRLGQDDADDPFLVSLHEFGHGGMDPLVGLGEHFTFGRADVLRLLLPLAIDFRLLVTDVLDEHAFPKSLVRFCSRSIFFRFTPSDRAICSAVCIAGCEPGA